MKVTVTYIKVIKKVIKAKDNAELLILIDEKCPKGYILQKF
jgi:hypothetical protein